MSQRTFASLFFIIFVSILSISYGHDDISQDIVEDIFQHAQTSIEQIENGKIYFNPEKVRLYQGKIYVEDEYGNGIAIPHVYSNGSRMFLDARKMQKYWICTTPWCQTAYYEKPNECLTCHTRSFIIRYR